MSTYLIAKRRYRSITTRNVLSKKTLNEEDFIEWYGEDFKKKYEENIKERKCEYCGIKESEIRDLISNGEIKTKRLLSRGRIMEIDRKNPHGAYEISNLVLSCYWCNNAKTDEFSFDEFKQIAKGIQEVWMNRAEPAYKEAVIKEEDNLLTDWDNVNNIVFVFPYGMYSIKKEDKESFWKTLDGLKNLIKEYTNVKVNLVYKDNLKINKSISTKKLYEDKDISIIPNPYLEDVWLKDFMPLVFSNKKALKTVYSPSYYNHKANKKNPDQRKYSFSSHMAGIELTEKLKLQYDYLGVDGIGYWYNGINDDYLATKDSEDLPVILDGSNFIHNGKIGFISSRVITENIDEDNNKKEMSFIDYGGSKNDTVKKLIELIEQKTKLKIYILPVAKKDGVKEETGHLGGIMRFLDESVILIDTDYYETHKEPLSNIFKVENINTEKITQRENSVLNYLRVQNVIFTPTNDESNVNEELTKICEAKGITLVSVKVDSRYLQVIGGFDCICWTY